MLRSYPGTAYRMAKSDCKTQVRTVCLPGNGTISSAILRERDKLFRQRASAFSDERKLNHLTSPTSFASSPTRIRQLCPNNLWTRVPAPLLLHRWPKIVVESASRLWHIGKRPMLFGNSIHRSSRPEWSSAPCTRTSHSQPILRRKADAVFLIHPRTNASRKTREFRCRLHRECARQ